MGTGSPFVSAFTLLFKEATSNSTFDVADTTALDLYLKGISYWVQDLDDMRMRFQELEASAVYLAERYAKRAKEHSAKYEKIKADLIVKARDSEKLKGDFTKAFVQGSPTYRKSKEMRNASESLAGLFDRLSWVVIRKHERIRDQGTKDARVGG